MFIVKLDTLELVRMKHIMVKSAHWSKKKNIHFLVERKEKRKQEKDETHNSPQTHTSMT